MKMHMKTKLLTTITLLLLSLLPVLGSTPWTSQTGLTETQLRDRLDQWTHQPAGLEPACISGYVENNLVRYSALWVRASDSDGRRVLIGETAGGLTTWNTSLQGNGWRLVWLNGYNADGVDYYNAIYRQTNGAAQTLRLGDPLADHTAANNNMPANLYLDNVIAHRSGLIARYSAWWTRSPSGLSPQTYISYSLSPANYQTEFNQRSATWRLVNVTGYRSAINSEDRYTTVWKKPTLGDGWASIHGMTKANYFAAQGNHVMVGWRPAFQQIWTAGTEVRCNAIWVQDGGLDGGRLGAFDNTIQTAMQEAGIPGLTLAISRHGRLVFARAWGLADQEAGEMAGPDHLFRVASVSKPICAVGVLHALEAYPGTLNSTLFGTNGLFGNTYGTAPYTARESAMTVRHLLHHNTGWIDDGRLWYHDAPGYGTNHELFIDWQLDNVGTVADPGVTGRYSNLGYTIAARVPEKLSGLSYRDYMQDRVLAACGIDGVLKMEIGGRTRSEQKFMEAAYYPYTTNDGGPYAISPARMDGSTAWIARPSDLLLFARRCDGLSAQEDILSASSITSMRTRSSTTTDVPNNSFDRTTYGLGWYTNNYTNPTRWGHNGSMNGTRAELVVRLDGYSYAWMTNTREGISNSSVDAFINATHAAGAWPDIDLSNSTHPAYDTWATTHFSSLDRGQPGLRNVIWGIQADPDADGIPNAAEAYLGLDPLVMDRTPFTVTRVGDTLRLRWQRVTAGTGVHPRVQSSSNLTSWLYPIGVTIDERPDLPTTVGKVYQEVLLPITGERRFMRLEFVSH